jgi:predicted secreted protein
LTKIKLTKNDNGKTVETRVGESGVIELPENPTTGGVWTLNVKEETGTASLSNSRYTAAKQSGIGGSSLWISRLKYCISCYDD